MSANRTPPSVLVRIAAIVGAIAAALAGLLLPPNSEPAELPVFDTGEQALREEMADRVAAAYVQGRTDAFKSSMCGIAGGRP